MNNFVKEKQAYTEAKIEIIKFDTEDVIRTSGFNSDDETEFDPAE